MMARYVFRLFRVGFRLPFYNPDFCRNTLLELYNGFWAVNRPALSNKTVSFIKTAWKTRNRFNVDCLSWSVEVYD